MNRAELWVLGGFATVLTFIFIVALLNCGRGAAACAIVDIAKTACDTLPIRYLGPDGVERVEHVPVSELRNAAEKRRLAREQTGRSDAGEAP